MTKIFGDTSTISTILTNTTSTSAVVGAMGVLTETGGTLTTDGNIQNLYINNAPAGVYVPRTLKIDMTNQTDTETIVIRESYRIETGGGWLEHDELTFVGEVDEDEITIHLDPNRYGIRVTIQNTAVGTHRAYVWEVTYEV